MKEKGNYVLKDEIPRYAQNDKGGNRVLMFDTFIPETDFNALA